MHRRPGEVVADRVQRRLVPQARDGVPGIRRGRQDQGREEDQGPQRPGRRLGRSRHEAGSLCRVKFAPFTREVATVRRCTQSGEQLAAIFRPGAAPGRRLSRSRRGGRWAAGISAAAVRRARAAGETAAEAPTAKPPVARDFHPSLQGDIGLTDSGSERVSRKATRASRSSRVKLRGSRKRSSSGSRNSFQVQSRVVVVEHLLEGREPAVVHVRSVYSTLRRLGDLNLP